MSYDNEKIRFGRQHIYIVEIDLDYCTLTAGTSPCTASETGNAKCFNTYDSCNDIPNYNKGVKTYRFCESVSPMPSALDAIPSLLRADIAPAQIDLAGGLGVRASVNLTFKDHPSSDLGIDKYLGDRTYSAFGLGTFWTKLRARNKNYQYRPLRILSGYLENGEYRTNYFDPINFITRYYVIDKMNVSGGKVTITAKDPLKLASNKKALAPKVTTGQLSADLTATGTTLTATPAGVGNSEYPASGKILINSEVISFTRSADVFTLTQRGTNNTLAVSHEDNDTIQLCLEYVGQSVNAIVQDLIANYADIDLSFIPVNAWASEVSTFLSGLLTGIIVKPFDVYKLLKELAENMPHYLWWDERAGVIQLTALKAPPSNSNVLDSNGYLVADSVNTTDKPQLRKSTIFVNFGQFDPTKKLDEFSNYQQTYARVDTDSIAKYGSNEIRTINSRWISNTNKAGALQLAALIGRRFSDIPREIKFSLDAKDSNIWIGQSVAVNHRDITDFTGAPIDTVFQLLSSKESENYNYTGIEYTYADSLPEDEGGGDPAISLVVLGSSLRSINLRTIFDDQFPAPDSSTQAKFVLETGVIIGSLSTSTSPASLVTGTWPSGATVTLQTNIGSYVVGYGGDAAVGAGDGQDGGTAIKLEHNLILYNSGIIGGGGGGANYYIIEGQGGWADGGGGGAGDAGGAGAGGVDSSQAEDGEDGTLLFGGTGGNFGGDLGADSEDGGVAGDAIIKGVYTLTAPNGNGDIRGNIVT